MNNVLTKPNVDTKKLWYVCKSRIKFGYRAREICNWKWKIINESGKWNPAICPVCGGTKLGVR